jgi:predicted dehydrogenase
MQGASTPISQLPTAIAVIGLGSRSRSLAINLLSLNKSSWNLTAVCEPNEDVLKEFQQSYPAVACFRSVEKLISYLKELSSVQEQCAYVAVPHLEYSTIVPLLLQARIHVLKEKPAAMTPTELVHFQDLANANAVRLLTASQTRYSRRTAEVKRLLPRIGTLRYVTYSRTIPVQGLGDGWRASRGAGVLGDLGWHVLDFVTNVVDSDQDPEIGYTDLFITRPAEGYDCEDTAHVVLKYKKLDAFGAETSVTCNLKISRVGPEKQDEMVFTGENGVLHVKDNKVVLATQTPPHKEALQLPPLKKSDVEETFRAFQCEVLEGPSPLFKKYALQDRTVTKIVQGAYDAFYKKSGICFDSQLALEGPDKRNNGLSDLEFDWPIISSDVEGAVVDQLHTTLSIYGNGGVFAEFEKEFKAMHEAPDHYSLLHNSGTNALQALYFGAKLLPGDEVSLGSCAYYNSFNLFGRLSSRFTLSMRHAHQLCTLESSLYSVTHCPLVIFLLKRSLSLSLPRRRQLLSPTCGGSQPI